MNKKLLTLSFIQKENYILLGMKKRGFGIGKWNGFGGKVKDGESIEEAAKRELKEEIGVFAQKLEKRGILNFVFDHNPEEILEVHVFDILDFEGEPIESEEMKPRWFKKEEVPFDSMWLDDKHWLPIFSAGKKFRGSFHFADDSTLLDYKIEEI